MGLKVLVCFFLIFLSISTSESNQVQENHTQGSLIHGHVGMKQYYQKEPSSHIRDVQVHNDDGDKENVMTYMMKSAHGTGGGMSSSIHHTGRNRATSLSTHSSFVFPCIVIFGLILFSII